MSVAALDSVMETQVAQLNLLLYNIYRPYFNGKIKSYLLLDLSKFHIRIGKWIMGQLLFAIIVTSICGLTSVPSFVMLPFVTWKFIFHVVTSTQLNKKESFETF